MIPADVLTIAAIVTGGEPAHLIGEQRKQAISAMHALGYSRDHMAWALDTTPNRVREVAFNLGLRLHHHDQRYDRLAVMWVCCGTPMPLRGADRDEAVRRLAPHCTAGEIARLLSTNRAQVSALASRLGVATNAGKNHRTLIAA